MCRDEKYDAATAYEVVGVVKDVHYFGLRQEAEPMVYLPVWQARRAPARWCSGQRGARAASGTRCGREVAAIDPAIPVMSMRTIEQHDRQQHHGGPADGHALRILRTCWRCCSRRLVCTA